MRRRGPGQAAPVLLVEKIAASVGIVAATVGVIVFLGLVSWFFGSVVSY